MTMASRGIRGPGSAPGIDLDAPIEEVARRAWKNPPLRAFGAPDPDGPRPGGVAGSALLALHLAAAYHRLAVICDVVDDYRRRARAACDEPVYLASIRACMAQWTPRHIAATFYRRALTADPGLAEAHYGLARVAMALGDEDAALGHFSTVVELSPHPDTPAHAHLHANAYWQQATLLEDWGDDEAALACYRQALSRVANFGVHHVRVAHFFRRLGLVEEAAAHYQRCMDYSHLYFAEFILPPLTPEDGSPADAAPEPIYTTSRGDIVVYWQGQYVAVPEAAWPAWRKETRPVGRGIVGHLFSGVGRLFARNRGALGAAVRHAQSIAAFEDPVEPEVRTHGHTLFEP